jgi:phosphoglucomutase
LARDSPPPAETFRARKIQPPTTKLYAESFKGSNHLRRIQEEAQAIIQRVFP